MTKAFTKLPQPRLQELVGEDLLIRLESLLPAITMDPDSSSRIFEKTNLAEIYDSFGATSDLASKEFRQELLEHQTEETINSICDALEIPSEGVDFSKKVEKIIRKGWRKPAIVKLILEGLGLSLEHAPIETQTQASQELIEPIQPPFQPLKEYQTSIFLKAKVRLNIPHDRFVIQMPTGSGKTRTAMEIICSFLNDTKQEQKNVLWLAHSGELCEQASSAFIDVWRHIGTRNIQLTRAWGSSKFIPPLVDDPILLIGGFQKLHSFVKHNSDASLDRFFSDFGLLIIDEAHKAIAPTYKEIINKFTKGGTRVIGLTATPGRSADNDDQNKALAEYFFEKIVNIESGGETVIEYLQNCRILAKAEYEPLVTDIDYELTSQQKKHLEQYFDLPPGFLKMLGNDDLRNMEIMKRLEEECKRGSRIIFFACSVEHSRFISSLLKYTGNASAHVDGEVPYSRRGAIINAFRSGETQVLCNYGVLSTGFDAPQVDVIFISRPTASVVLYSQMIGRGLRGPEIGGTERCKIIDVKDNIIGYSNEDKVYNYFEEYWTT